MPYRRREPLTGGGGLKRFSLPSSNSASLLQLALALLCAPRLLRRVVDHDVFDDATSFLLDGLAACHVPLGIDVLPTGCLVAHVYGGTMVLASRVAAVSCH